MVGAGVVPASAPRLGEDREGSRPLAEKEETSRTADSESNRLAKVEELPQDEDHQHPRVPQLQEVGGVRSDHRRRDVRARHPIGSQEVGDCEGARA